MNFITPRNLFAQEIVFIMIKKKNSLIYVPGLMSITQTLKLGLNPVSENKLIKNNSLFFPLKKRNRLEVLSPGLAWHPPMQLYGPRWLFPFFLTTLQLTGPGLGHMLMPSCWKTKPWYPSICPGRNEGFYCVYY